LYLSIQNLDWKSQHDGGNCLSKYHSLKTADTRLSIYNSRYKSNSFVPTVLAISHKNMGIRFANEPSSFINNIFYQCFVFFY
jgi:hypothetical protein